MTEQEKKELLKDVRTYMTDPKNSQKWKMAPYFSSVVLNFLNNYADKFDDKERVMNVVERLKVEPFRKGDDYLESVGSMVGKNSTKELMKSEMQKYISSEASEALKVLEASGEKISLEELPKKLTEEIKKKTEEFNKNLREDKAYREEYLNGMNKAFDEEEQIFDELFPISLRLNQYTGDKGSILTDEEGKVVTNEEGYVNLKPEKIAELFASLDGNVDPKENRPAELSSLYNNYETLTHELTHALASYKTDKKAYEEASVYNFRDRYMGGVNFDKLNYIHEGMTEWLAQKAVRNLNKETFSKIGVSYEPFVYYAEIISTLFPKGFYDIYFNGTEKLKKYENIYPDLSLNDMITKYGKVLQNLQNFENQKEKDDFTTFVCYEDLKYQFSDLKRKVLNYAEKGIISQGDVRFILGHMNVCYKKFPNSNLFPIDFLTESCDKRFVEFEQYELENRLALNKSKYAKNKEGDFENLIYINIKQDKNIIKKIHTLSKEKMEELTEGKVIGLNVLNTESENFDTKIWILKDGTVGFGDNAIKAFRQHKYDITDAVMIDCKYDKMPQIIKQDNGYSLGRYRSARAYEEIFIHPDYKTKQKLSKEQSYSVLDMAISVLPKNKDPEVMFFDNLEFDEEALEDLHQRYPKIKLSKVSPQKTQNKQDDMKRE